MMLLRGALHNGLMGVAVTTGDYNGPALDEALKEPRMWALNGDQFLRYMTYVRGSRPKTNPATSSAGKHPVIFTPAADFSRCGHKRTGSSIPPDTNEKSADNRKP